jgi:hypothetical protein
MYDVDLIRARLDALADPAYARRQRQHLRPLRGLRGVPSAELARLLVVELSEGHADLHTELAHLADRFQDRLEAAVAGADALPRRTHAEAGRAVGLGSDGMRENFRGGHERLRLESGVVVRALRAVAAILAARARLDAEQGTKLHLASGPMPLVGAASLRDEIEKRAIVDFLELRERLFHCAGA